MCDGNLYAIEQHLKEQEFLEEAAMKDVELVDAYECGGCGELHLTNAQAAKCCGASVEIDYIEDVYTCTKCGMVSEDLDDIKGHDND